VTGGLAVEDADRLELAARIKADFSAHGAKMGELRRSLEHWVGLSEVSWKKWTPMFHEI
jgi:hypothetical protein